MILSQLQINYLRNLSALRVQLHPHLNIITGANGSGKTSFLEAIYLLGCGHSFRTREIIPLITQGESTLTIYAKANDEQSISIKKSLSAATIVRINSSPCLSTSELAQCLPTQVFYQDIFQIIDAGPSVRRSLLDWGLFHVKPEYHHLWKNYRRALKQRNNLLRQKAPANQLLPWNKIMGELAEQLDLSRQEYVLTLNEKFQQVLNSLTQVGCQLTYYKGWDRRQEGKSLETILTQNYERDMHRLYTHYGAHQAELLFTTQGHATKQFFSRGQQKIVLFALKFAQVQLLSKPCLFLIDDISAELDEIHIQRVLDFILASQGQFFITTHINESFITRLIPESFNLLQLPLS